MASSGKARRSTPSPRARSIRAFILAVFPARSPTVELVCTRPRRRVRIDLKNGQVALQLVVGDVGSVAVPLHLLVGQEACEDMLPQGLPHQLAFFHKLDGLPEAPREGGNTPAEPFLLVHVIDVLLHRLRGLQALLNPP